jgi:hypothetical protein
MKHSLRAGHRNIEESKRQNDVETTEVFLKFQRSDEVRRQVEMMLLSTTWARASLVRKVLCWER